MTDLSVQIKSQTSRLYCRHTYSGFSTVWICPSLLVQIKAERQIQIHIPPRSANVISLDFCVEWHEGNGAYNCKAGSRDGLFCSVSVAARHINDLTGADRVTQLTAKRARLYSGWRWPFRQFKLDCTTQEHVPENSIVMRKSFLIFWAAQNHNHWELHQRSRYHFRLGMTS